MAMRLMRAASVGRRGSMRARGRSTGSAGGPGRALALALALGLAGTGVAVRALADGPAAPDSAARPAPAGAPPAREGPDYSGYQKLLDEFVWISSPPGAPLETRFDYGRLYIEAGRDPRLFRIRHQLLAVPPSRLSGPARLAWAINTYNFLAIETVTQNLFDPRLVRSFYNNKRIQTQRPYKTVQQIRVENGSLFTAPLVEIEGVSYSLDAFERRFVFAGFDKASSRPPPPGLDPRAHFALVCAAAGCPPLLPRAYDGDSLDAQLEFAVTNALAGPRHLRWDAPSGTLQGSSIFLWYQADFGGRAKAFEFLKRYAPAAVRNEIERRKITGFSAAIPWDWSINQGAGKRKPAPAGGDSTARLRPSDGVEQEPR